MEVRNSAAESQTSDRSQPIQETEGDADASKMLGAPVDVLAAAGGEGIEMELGSGGGGAELAKKKRGRPPRVQPKSPPAKIIKEEDEDVCFICFDGGSLVLCDRRGCPKAYHPACVKRDEAFFRSKAKWNCGWHICSICQKTAHHMCYTCTYSLCKGCIKKADYVCVRGDKGFCTVCMKTIMLIENNGQGKDEKAPVDFDDKTSWEYLFKVYWVYLKGKLSLTLDELTQAKNPWKEASSSTTTTIASVTPSTCVNNGVNDSKSINLEASESKRRKTDEQSITTTPLKETIITKKLVSNEVAYKEWATKELLEFVSHMKNGDTSVLSQFDVQELMLEYIKRNNLRDPKKKSQILCDSRLKILFGKPRVGHFEMLKLLEFHFFIREDLPKNTINGIAKQGVDPDWNNDNVVTNGKEKKRRNHKKVEERAPQNKVDEYAAINVHNMNLVYLRRKYAETLIENSEEFHGKVVGSIVRIRISGSDQKHDLYRLVQVVGTSKADAPYKIGDKSADMMLEVLNLDKKETVCIDTISNQDLSEDECRRLRQSIKCGLVKRFTVGEIQDKAVSLQSVRLNDLMEAETLRLNNLRDRASEKGHKKGLREYVEKLQILKTPEERERRLREIPEVHSDPKMNPDYETDDTEEYFNKEQEPMKTRKLKLSVVSRKSTTNSVKKPTEFLNNTSNKSWKNEQQPKHQPVRISIGKDASVKPENSVDCNGSKSETATTSSYSIKKTLVVSNDSEIEKVWHYRDPSGKIQGPFCMIQLQKWNSYFPTDMRIWTKREEESLLLNDVLEDESHKARLSENQNATDKVDKVGSVHLTIRTPNPLSTINHENWSNADLASPTPVENKTEVKNVSSAFDIANAELVDLPSPTPKVKGEEDEDEKVGNVAKTGGGDEWGGYSPTTRVKCEELNSSSDPKVEVDCVATTSTTTSSNVEQIIATPPSSQPAYNNYFPAFQGERETIEFSTYPEESVSDLLAEVAAMESQNGNGAPSPTSRRNSFVDDLFNGSFEEFSPTPHHPATNNVFEMPFKWPEIPQQNLNHSIKPEEEAIEGEKQSTQPSTTNAKNGSPELVLQTKVEKPGEVEEENDGLNPMEAAPPSLSLAIGLDKGYPRRVGPEPVQVNFNNSVRQGQEVPSRVNSHLDLNRGNVGWEPHHQRTYNGDRFNNNSNNNNYNRTNKPWGRQPSVGSGGVGGSVGGGYTRPPPPKGQQRVCKFYESGRCKKGASCNYLHP